MLQEIVITPSTVAIILAVIAGMALAVRRIFRKGLCDCGDSCSACDGCSKKADCKDRGKCPVASDMVESMEKSAS